MPGLAFCCRNTVRRAISTRSQSLSTGDGMRANEENSSIIPPISSTCRMIVSIQALNICGSFLISAKYFRRKRSADSWIGVSGFLIS